LDVSNATVSSVLYFQKRIPTKSEVKATHSIMSQRYEKTQTGCSECGLQLQIPSATHTRLHIDFSCSRTVSEHSYIGEVGANRPLANAERLEWLDIGCF